MFHRYISAKWIRIINSNLLDLKCNTSRLTEIVTHLGYRNRSEKFPIHFSIWFCSVLVSKFSLLYFINYVVSSRYFGNFGVWDWGNEHHLLQWVKHEFHLSHTHFVNRTVPLQSFILNIFASPKQYLFTNP